MNTGQLWRSVRMGLVRNFPARIRRPRDKFFIGVLSIALVSALLDVVLTPTITGKWISTVFSVLILGILVAFVRGLSEKGVVYLAAVLGLAYLFTSSLTSGYVYSSTMAWMALIPLAIFYVVNPAAGGVWMVLVIALELLMAAVAWFWGGGHTSLNLPELQLLSLMDYLLVSMTLFLVPNFYQQELEGHLQARRQRQRELQAKQLELEQMLRMREHFIGTVSHELRTPMNAILGLNAVLLERVQGHPHAQKVLEYTRQSADHLMTVINDVLDYSQFSSGHISARAERFALLETVHAAFDLFQPKVKSTQLRYICLVEPEVPQWVETDKHRLMQVLVNLLGNAIKFTHQGQVVLRVSVRGEGLELAVEDTGIGIAAQQQQKIFERFSQADASIQGRFGGSGLGLTISQQLVHILGGQLQLESQEGAGSRFWFWLPLQAVAAPQTTPMALAQTPASTQQALRFLVVDDHPVNRLLLRLLLGRKWSQACIVEVEDGAQAMQALSTGPAFDLVLLDMVMPVMDGIETARAMRASDHAPARNTPVLGLTANVSTLDLQRFKDAGLNGLLLKPFDAASLYREVERLTANARHQSVQV
jgi:signal transduction histidine kinase/CheY-like chemotaxis protein